MSLVIPNEMFVNGGIVLPHKTIVFPVADAGTIVM